MPTKLPTPPQDLDLKAAIQKERRLLTQADVPIVTVSATFRKELAKKFRARVHTPDDVVYSRAHYSMAEAIRQQAIRSKKSPYLIDPMNYASKEGWGKIDFTEEVGHLMARYQVLKTIKDKIDTFMRGGHMPYQQAIIAPLKYLTQNIKQPILSMHYEAGNLLHSWGHSILQAITDPHVRPQYLDPLPNLDGEGQQIFADHSDPRTSRAKLNKSSNQSNQILDDQKNFAAQNQTKSSEDKKTVTNAIQPKSPNSKITYAVFDEETKQEFLHLAQDLGKAADPDQVVVTGPPVDPRIATLGKTPKKLHQGQPIHLAVTTGGIGTNLKEIIRLLNRLAPLLRPPEKIRLFLYAGTHRDFRNFYEDYARENHIRIGNWDDDTARIRIMHDDSIIDANDNLIKYVFPWAHGIITKPSGDMAYDAAAAGCFTLFLEPWGDWEQNIQDRFTRLGLGFDLHVDTALSHFKHLYYLGHFQTALKKVHRLPALYRQGAKNILDAYFKLVNL